MGRSVGNHQRRDRLQRYFSAFFMRAYALSALTIAPRPSAFVGRQIVYVKAFDKAKIPAEGRMLVLCADHVADLLEQDQKFAAQYYNYESGAINRMYGFEVYEYDACPYYNTSTKKKLAYGAVPATATDRQCSVAFSRCCSRDVQLCRRAG